MQVGAWTQCFAGRSTVFATTELRALLSISPHTVDRQDHWETRTSARTVLEGHEQTAWCKRDIQGPIRTMKRRRLAMAADCSTCEGVFSKEPRLQRSAYKQQRCDKSLPLFVTAHGSSHQLQNLVVDLTLGTTNEAVWVGQDPPPRGRHPVGGTRR